MKKYIFCCYLLLLPAVQGRICGSSDYDFEYTSCDSVGSRWRVAVPRDGSNCQGGLPDPQRGLNCSFSCASGHYLDLDTQSCRECEPGRYSLGGGIRFEEFVTLPPGFMIENFEASADQLLSTSTGPSVACAPETGWLVQDGELLYVPTPCISRLSFSATLVRPGLVDFSYRMPRNNRALSLQVDVRNQQCQSYRDLLQSAMQKYKEKGRKQNEDSGEWQRKQLDLRTGSTVISWTVSKSAGYDASPEPIRISRIDVLGLAFTRECSLCPEGTYSTRGASECQPCGAGYYSQKGSSSCGKCPQTQYSGYKSGRCTDRPPCKSSDYYPVMEPCMNGSTRTTYKKVLPAVCREDLDGAASLPPPTSPRPCPKCNPGMEKNKSGQCVFCPKEHFSDGNACARCPAETVPNYGLQYAQWDVLPPHLSTKCEYISEEVLVACDIGESWLASGSALTSAPSSQTGIAMELVLNLPNGFFNPLAPVDTFSSVRYPVAHITIVFETSCRESSCILYFIEDTSPSEPKESSYRFLAAFNGTQPRRVWSHSIIRHSPSKFLVAFVRSRATSGDDVISDEARILSINVTNIGHGGGVQGGGASQCLPCPSRGGGCVPCPPGHYMDSSSHECRSCPPNHIVNASSDRVGQSTCLPCGSNLISTDGVLCKSDGKFTISSTKSNRTLSYDISSLVNKTWVTNGVKVFAREGTSYFHTFNISLLGSPIKCREVYEPNDALGITDQAKEEVEGAACRLTALPISAVNKSSLAYVSPLLLASRLEEISTNRKHNDWQLTDQMLEYEGMDNTSLPMDFHLWFDSTSITTETCKRGNSLVATLRCVPSQKTPLMRLPHTCPDGTCDGCLFHLIIETSQACPVCKKGDYETIRGECKGGQQTVHFIPDKHCVLTGAAAESKKEACSNLTSQEKAAIVAGVVTLVALIFTLIIICRRNRKLEYKYTRLVESHNGELPAAETCGLEDDEEEDEADRVVFSKGKKRLFGTKMNRGDNTPFVPLENDD